MISRCARGDGQKIASTEGLRIEVHGAGHPAGTYVGTNVYDNIFNAVQLSLLTKDPAVRATIATLNRHDVIRVWGKLLDFNSPQPHVGIARMVIEKKYVHAGRAHEPEVDWTLLAKKLKNWADKILCGSILRSKPNPAVPFILS